MQTQTYAEQSCADIQNTAGARVSRTCECGERKKPRAEACDRCLRLDGESGRMGYVIAAMRSIGGPASVEEIARASGYSIRSVWYALSELADVSRIASARVAVAEEDGWEASTYWLTEGHMSERHRKRAKYHCHCGAFFATKGGYGRHAKPHPETGRSKCRQGGGKT